MLSLRPIEPEDAPALHALQTHPEVARFLGTETTDTLEVTRKRLEEADPERVHRLELVDGGALLGEVKLAVEGRPRLRHVARLSVSVDPRVHGKGHGTTLVGAAVSLADRWLDVVRVELDVHADHAPAIRLYERHGFEREALKPGEMLRDGRAVPSLHMGRLRPGLVPQRAGTPPPPAPPWRPPPGTIAIRPVTPADAPAFAAFHRTPEVVWGTNQLPSTTTVSWHRRLVAGAVDPHRVALFVATVSGRLAAAGGLFRRTTMPRLAHTAVLGLAVDPAFHGMGVGTALLGALVAEADRAGLGRVELEVFADHDRAKRLYERHGRAGAGVRRAAAFRGGGYADVEVRGRVRG